MCRIIWAEKTTSEMHSTIESVCAGVVLAGCATKQDNSERTAKPSAPALVAGTFVSNTGICGALSRVRSLRAAAPTLIMSDCRWC